MMLGSSSRTSGGTQSPPFAPPEGTCLGHKNEEEKLVWVTKRLPNGVNYYRCRDCGHDFTGAGPQVIWAHFHVPLMKKDGSASTLPLLLENNR